MGVYMAPISTLKWTHPWNPPKKETHLTHAEKCRSCLQPSEMAAYKTLRFKLHSANCYVIYLSVYFTSTNTLLREYFIG